MKIYLVRHGQSLDNSKDIHQGEVVDLSEEGLQQARYVADHLKDLKPDLFISSNLNRAQQTAAVINEHLKQEIITSPLFKEFKRPTELYGLVYGCEEALAIWEQVDSHRDDPIWHYSDEENFNDFKNRGLKALEYLTKENVQTILTVSHGLLISLLICLIIYGNDITEAQFYNFREIFNSSNTGISVLEYNFDEKKWKIISLNSTHHLKG